jgi:hypothetical protein
MSLVLTVPSCIVAIFFDLFPKLALAYLQKWPRALQLPAQRDTTFRRGGTCACIRINHGLAGKDR